MSDPAEDTQPIRAVDDSDVPTARPGVGSRLLDLASGSIPADRAADLKTAANLLDAAPEIARQIYGLMSPDASLTTGKIPVTASRWPLVLVSVFLAAMVASCFMAAVWSISDMRSEIADQAAAHDTEIARHEEILGMLTELMLGRMTALGKQTGADQLPEWTEVPADLSIIALQRKRDKGQSGG